ncbi:MAG: hypothetical protein ACC612_10880 [Methanomethylovorans sp.]|uniref:hypothetical protein n=1 Tax=Methanomethylovorans sp. TaxID=2758717 RepID=UPI003530D645
MLKKNIALIASIGILWITVASLLITSIKINQGHIAYALDDAYIHMSIAKNFALHGVWGITQYDFASSSSSLLYTLLLSFIYFLFGVNEVIPLILNIIFATLSIWVIYCLLKQNNIKDIYIFILLQLIIFLTPLPALIFTGMEHTLQILITIPFVYLSAKIISEGNSSNRNNTFLFILGIFVTMVRYEGIFLLLVVSSLFILNKKWKFAVGLLVSGFFPIVIYGIISLLKGWYFLPNSIILKGNTPTFSILGLINFFTVFIHKIIETSHIFVLVYGALILFIYQFHKQKKWSDSTTILSVFILTSILHIMFASTGWFYRYEAYLVCLGIFAIAIGFQESLSQNLSLCITKNILTKYIAIILLVLIVISPLTDRGYISLTHVTQATNNIYEQQYQMGLFLKQFYGKESVAVNDIGAVSYLSDVKTVDLIGLGNIKVAKLRRENIYDIQKIQDLATEYDVKIAIIYDSWFTKGMFAEGIPSDWIAVGQWTIPNNVVCGGDTVTFYATNPEEERKLKENLRIFSSNLPIDIKQSGSYLL